MDNKKFAVVHFPCDNSVEVVPRQWMLEGEKSSKYPPERFRGSIKNAVKNVVEPQDDWLIYEIEIYKWFGKKK
jgi:hypothetical protein